MSTSQSSTLLNVVRLRLRRLISHLHANNSSILVKHRGLLQQTYGRIPIDHMMRLSSVSGEHTLSSRATEEEILAIIRCPRRASTGS